jgi:hypothetical protein
MIKNATVPAIKKVLRHPSVTMTHPKGAAQKDPNPLSEREIPTTIPLLLLNHFVIADMKGTHKVLVPTPAKIPYSKYNCPSVVT